MRFPPASYNTPIQSKLSCPIIGWAALLNLTKVSPQLQDRSRNEKGILCLPTVSPPPTGESPEITQLWVKLPAANRHRLTRLLSQMLGRQLTDPLLKGETNHELEPHH
jgi:hypothetical protein